MKNKYFFLLAIAIFFDLPKINAQDSFISQDYQGTIFEENSLGDFSTLNYRRRSNDFAFGLHAAFNTNKLGAGIRFSYQFTDILRFTLDGDYYFHTNELRKFNTITRAGVKDEKYWGRSFDFNPNLNFVFGDGNFHFYIIGGLYFCSGWHEGANAINELNSFTYSDNYTTDAEGNKWFETYVSGADGKTYYIDEELVHGIGIGVNAGCGIEFQILEELRLNFEQQLSLGLMTSWMAKLGVAYCF